MEEVNARSMMSDAKFYESYSRYIDSENRYETWDESVDRVMNMHRDYYKDKMCKELDEAISFATRAYKDKRVLGAQRALQFGGDQLLKHHTKMYNCFSEDTRFITSDGVKSFLDFKEGDTCEVITHTGEWKKATVNSYGSKPLLNIGFQKGNSKVFNVRATPDHRWIIEDGSETTTLTLGDKVKTQEDHFREFVFKEADTAAQLYWCYGFIYGDGTLVRNSKGEVTGSRARLCGNKSKFEERFTSLGFSSSSSLSLDGDVVVYTGSYKKTLPNLNLDDPSIIKAFVNGYLCADGEINKNAGGKQFNSIYTSDDESLEFIKDAFPVAGVYCLNTIDMSGMSTNLGIRNNGTSLSIYEGNRSKYDKKWKVVSIEETQVEEVVWCLEVEDDRSFTLENGIVTGNCTASHCDRPEFFGEAMYQALSGAGIGFSVQYHHINKLPKVLPRKGHVKQFIVKDSIEGWAEAVDVLLSSFFEGGGKHPEYEGRKIYFDTNHIRPKGSKISGGFKAPGPEPLEKALNYIERLLTDYVESGEDKLRPIQCYDIIMYAMDSVISGGVRRSASICLFSPEDEEMMASKTGNWFAENPQRGRSNNSALIVRSEINKEQFNKIFENVKQFGEPGFIFAENKEHMFNPCVEVGMLPVLQDTGETGWQGCNLTEINGGKCTSEDYLMVACEAAAIIGTLQAGYTDFKFLSGASKKIYEREALIGVSITGWMNNPDVLFNKSRLKRAAKHVKETNKKIANLIGINPAARTTVVKPSGNASTVLSTASGIHAEHSKRYIRNVQMNKDTEVAKLVKEANPYMIEDSVYSANSTDYVISFPVIPKEGSIYREESKNLNFLEKVKLVQQSWIEAGTDEDLCTDPTLRHNVSNTVTVDHDKWDEVRDYVFKNRNYFAGISFLAASGDKDYNQAPNTEVLTAEEIVDKYGPASLFASGLIVDSHKGFRDLWEACSVISYGDSAVPQEKVDQRADWIRRFYKFSDNYFDGDLKKTEYCLKDSYLLWKWEKITNNLKDVDFQSELKEKKYTKVDTLGAIACSGGACEVSF